MQLQMTFNPTHLRENNPESQKVLDLRKDDFSRDCWKVLKRMLSGEKLTVSGTAALGENHISSLPRRAQDLIEYKGIPVKREFAVIDGVQQKYKWYYIAEQDREKVMRRIIDWMKAL